MARKQDTNTIESRLKDAKTEYEANEIFINSFINKVKKGEEVTPNEVKEYKDFLKINTTIRKQINDMEVSLQNGQIKATDEANPFTFK